MKFLLLTLQNHKQPFKPVHQGQAFNNITEQLAAYSRDGWNVISIQRIKEHKQYDLYEVLLSKS